MDKINKYLLAVISGLLLFLAFPPVNISYLAWVGFVPFFYSVRTGNNKKSFLNGYLTGLIFFGLLLYWMVNVTIPGMIVLVLVLSVFFGLFGYAANLIFFKSIDMLVLSFIWIILEFARSTFLTGFPWGLLGYSQYRDINIIQISDFTGAYGVSFLIMCFNVSLFALFSKSKKRIAYLMTSLLFITLATSYGIYKKQNYFMQEGPTISVVQGNIPQEDKWDDYKADKIINIYEGLTIQASSDNPDLVIWPETAYPYLITEEKESFSELESFSKQSNVNLLIGTVLFENERYYNSAILLSGEEDKSVYKKVHLVPFGEYIPFTENLNFLRKYIDKPIGSYSPGEEFSLFKLRTTSFGEANSSRTRMIRFYKYGVMICFEDTFPYIARKFVSGGANFLVNMTNDAWFGQTAAPLQHMQASVFRAVENRCPVIRAANTGISCFISMNGEVSDIVGKEDGNIFTEGYVTSKIEVGSRKSFYTVYGDLFVLFSLFMAIFIIVAQKFIKNVEK